MQKYLNRRQAGTVLAEHLKQYAHQKNTWVLALPRGGVPVAYEVANALNLPLDIFIVRKLGVPGHEELAMGAIAANGTIIFNNAILQNLMLSETDIQQVIQAEQQELQRRELAYRGNRPLPDLTDKIIILVDEGIATGASIRAAIKALRQKNVQKIILAVPVAATDTVIELINLADEIICPLQSTAFYAVGAWYEDFTQTTDEEVFQLLKLHK